MSYVNTIILLFGSNVFMTFAWYGHLKHMHYKGLWITILLSWSIAFFEYMLQVPANRIGFESGAFSLFQLKLLQEIISLSVFLPFALFYMRQPFSWNFVWAGMCILGAVYFIFR